MIEAVAYAHRQRIIHCDIKPENFILFPDNRLRLTDFGIARVAQNTVAGSGSGTVGYMAPEQAMGKPSMRSDVFSLGLVIYRMLTGQLPEWPFEWPPPRIPPAPAEGACGHDRGPQKSLGNLPAETLPRRRGDAAGVPPRQTPHALSPHSKKKLKRTARHLASRAA
jgi:serine/threonine protein kinase